jgi:cyclophilin family peptidyl-prolyl cis-trans isomerase/HEAT repeat protein
MISQVSTLLLVASLAGGQLLQRGVQPGQQPFLRRDRSSRVLYAKILEAEDRRQLSKALIEMLSTSHAGVRRRAAIAVGRIGDPAGVTPLLTQLGDERNPAVVADFIFALGEVEDPRAAPKLLEVLAKAENAPAVRARAAEALGKIAANPAVAQSFGEARLGQVAAAVAAALPPADRAVSGDDLLLGSLATTALLRIKHPSSLAPLTAQLSSATPALRWQAANAIARMRPDSAAAAGAVAPLTAQIKDSDPVVRATAARALGALKATSAAGALTALLGDADQRVVGSAVRALGALGERSAVAPLNALGARLLETYRREAAGKSPGVPEEHNLLMLVAEALGALEDPSSLPLLQRVRALDGGVGANPETELAVAAYGDAAYFDLPNGATVPAEWHHAANYAQGLGAVGGERARAELLDLLAGKRLGQLDPRAVPDALTAVAKLKPEGLEQILIDHLAHKDVVVRATAAGLLGESFATSESESTFKALEAALKSSAEDRENDAKLAIMDAIGKYKRMRAQELLAAELAGPDYVVRRRAADLLAAAGAGSFTEKVPPALTPERPRGYYERLEAAMRGANPVATIATEKGDIRVELLIREAPLNVDNFIELARKSYFDGIAFHRVVPNFVVQGGDPRGDGNGGPGYQIRCEINEVPYDRGTVGMALSGKDTGGSQFFFTHSPQPHLDGGYTAFGRVTGGMEVVDRIARGDKIISVTVATPQ